MITKLLWGLVLVVLIAILVGYSPLPTVERLPKIEDECQSLLCHIVAPTFSLINVFKEVGNIIIIFGEMSHTILGLLTCLILPLAGLGLWALGKLQISTNPFGGYGGRR